MQLAPMLMTRENQVNDRTAPLALKKHWKAKIVQKTRNTETMDKGALVSVEKASEMTNPFDDNFFHHSVDIGENSLTHPFSVDAVRQISRNQQSLIISIDLGPTFLPAHNSRGCGFLLPE